MQKMRLLLITPEYPPHNIGGGGVAMKNLVHALLNYDVSVTVVSGYYKSDSFNGASWSDESNSHELYYLPMVKNFLNAPLFTTRMPASSNSVKFLKEMLLEKKFDCAIVMGGFEPFSVQMSWELKKKGVPYFVDVQGFPEEHQYSSLINFIFRQYKKFILHNYFLNSQRVIVTSDHMLPEYQPAIIPNGIFIDEFAKVTPIDLHSEFSIPANSKILVSVGRLHSQKGFQHVIPAVNSLKNVYYIIVGPEDGYEKQLSKMSGPNVIFAGKKNKEEIIGILKAADIVIIPSLVEGFGIVGLEAMAAERPIIANPVGGLLQFLKNNETAMLVDVTQQETLKEKILFLLDNNDIAAKIARNAKISAARYDWSIIAKQFIELIQKM